MCNLKLCYIDAHIQSQCHPPALCDYLCSSSWTCHTLFKRHLYNQRSFTGPSLPQFENTPSDHIAMKTSFAAISLLAATSAAALGPNAPPAASIQIGEISYSGTGCPQGSATFILSDAKDIVTFGFDKFQATIGPSSPPGDSRKNCNIKMQLKYSDGFQMAIAETVYHGYTRLDDGVNAKFTTDYDYLKNPNPGKKVLFVLQIPCIVNADSRRVMQRARRTERKTIKRGQDNEMERESLRDFRKTTSIQQTLDHGLGVEKMPILLLRTAWFLLLGIRLLLGNSRSMMRLSSSSKNFRSLIRSVNELYRPSDIKHWCISVH